MSANPSKYVGFPAIKLKDRTWPDNVITQAPMWCAVDLRDGNQALVNPMDLDRKMKMYKLLVEMGFKEIEIGFPSSSDIEFNFARKIIEEGLVPKDVTPQVLVQARKHLIEKTFEAMKGVHRCIIHLYNSTSVAQRRDVFKMGPDGIAKMACDGVKLVKELAAKYPETEWVLEYSPESFTGTELEVAADICNAVINEWGPTPDNKMIINLPSTVELSSVNVFADQIEWMGRHLDKRDSVTLSVHTHNDRGGGEAASELAVLAGADRIEGTLLGNGERTGNADLVVLALNLLTQGVDPQLNVSDLEHIVEVVEECNQMDTHPRHPYAGELVFTALSGSHQDAIKKGLDAHNTDRRNHWDVPYLPIDPKDIGRTYETAIRINSQSGKSGIAYILETGFGFKLPKAMQIEFSKVIQKIADETAKEISADQIWEAFNEEYIEQEKGYELISFQHESVADSDMIKAVSKIKRPNGEVVEFSSEGNGIINSFVQGFKQIAKHNFKLNNYEEHTQTSGSSAANAAAYISLVTEAGEELYGVGVEGAEFYGVGLHSDIGKASLKGIISAYNRINSTL